MLTLQAPALEWLPSYLDFVEEMRSRGEPVWDGMVPRANESAEDFVKRQLRAATDPEPGMVAQTSYWACVGPQVVGRIALRHELNESLLEFGGHIGYEVRPSSRRQGYAREMLRLVLESPRAKSIGKLLLTCGPDNVASNRTILANGGRWEKCAYVATRQRETNYYWIDLTANAKP